jgi:hypothetical protein
MPGDQQWQEWYENNKKQHLHNNTWGDDSLLIVHFLPQPPNG